MILTTVLIIIAYLAGSISSAILVCKFMGLPDPRSGGSGNPGATNVLRVGNKKAAAITLFFDNLKGFVPVVLAKALTDDVNVICITAIAAIVGHLFPVFFGFKGGKGVATTGGVFFGLSLPIGGLILLTWLFFAKTTKISAIGGLMAASSAPFYFAFMTDEVAYVYTSALLALILVYRHKTNIRDLLQGKKDKTSDENS